MKKFPHRVLALALCFTLTLSAFTYRPPKAEASVAAAVLSPEVGGLIFSWLVGCGVVFDAQGLSGNMAVEALEPTIKEYLESQGGLSSFEKWLGYDSVDDLAHELALGQNGVLYIPRPVARLLNQFTEWFVKKYSSASIEQPSTIKKYGPSVSLGRSTYALQNMDVSIDVVTGDVLPKPAQFGITYAYPLGANGYYLSIYAYGDKDAWDQGKNQNYKVELLDSDGNLLVVGGWDISMDVYLGYTQYSDYVNLVWAYNGQWRNSKQLKVTWTDVLSSSLAKDGAALAVVGATIGALPDVAGDDAKSVGISTGVQADTVNGVLTGAVGKVSANELAPTIDTTGEETGDNTGDKADEDAKPYLPYIPRIFEKIGELPNLIAEKIGAFFTTLWGWLQSIIEAITSLPTAIAEKVGELFKPDEALVAEITDTFKGKFGFLPTLKRFGDDLFGMTAETEPPVIWVHFENAESKYGYDYGGKEKMLDLSWYQKYKANVDTLISGFLWLGFLWLLFKRAAAIIQGGEMLAEYNHDILQGRRDSNETKFQRYLWKD